MRGAGFVPVHGVRLVAASEAQSCLELCRSRGLFLCLAERQVPDVPRTLLDRRVPFRCHDDAPCGMQARGTVCESHGAKSCQLTVGGLKSCISRTKEARLAIDDELQVNFPLITTCKIRREEACYRLCTGGADTSHGHAIVAESSSRPSVLCRCGPVPLVHIAAHKRRSTSQMTIHPARVTMSQGRTCLDEW